MATVVDLKVPVSSKAILQLKFGKHVSLRVDICEMFGHVWNWQDKVPAGFDGRWASYGDGNIQGNLPYSAPFCHGYAWVCEREGCEKWLGVHQLDSSRYVPIARQEVTYYGSFGSYEFRADSPFCQVNQARKEKALARG